jgi:hypothetical protein
MEENKGNFSKICNNCQYYGSGPDEESEDSEKQYILTKIEEKEEKEEEEKVEEKGEKKMDNEKKISEEKTDIVAVNKD